MKNKKEIKIEMENILGDDLIKFVDATVDNEKTYILNTENGEFSYEEVESDDKIWTKEQKKYLDKKFERIFWTQYLLKKQKKL